MGISTTSWLKDQMPEQNLILTEIYCIALDEIVEARYIVVSAMNSCVAGYTESDDKVLHVIGMQLPNNSIIIVARNSSHR